MASFTLNVNGSSRQVDVDPNTPILWVLRDHLSLVGTKFGCGMAQCGACTIHLDGAAIRSCSLPVSNVGSSEITTIEGLAEKEEILFREAGLVGVHLEDMEFRALQVALAEVDRDLE